MNVLFTIFILAIAGHCLTFLILIAAPRYSQPLYYYLRNLLGNYNEKSLDMFSCIKSAYKVFTKPHSQILRAKMSFKHKIFQAISATLFISCGFTISSNNLLINKPEKTLLGVILLTLLLILALIDIHQMRLPTDICITGISLGLLATIISSTSMVKSSGINIINDHIFALLGGLAIMRSISSFSKTLTEKECLGIGDANLVALGGAWLGSKGLFTAMSIAFISAGMFSLISILSGLMKPSQPFPFGPFISGGIWGVWCTSTEWWGLH